MNLKQLYGNRYVVRWSAERPGKSMDPAYYEIPLLGRAGHIYAHGEDTLAVTWYDHRRWLNQLREIGCQDHQIGDHEFTVLFDISFFDLVAQIVKPKRKRVMTDEQKRAASDRLKKFWFTAAD